MPPAPNLATWTAAAESLPAVARALAVDLSEPSADGCTFLFVVLRPGQPFDDSLRLETHRRAMTSNGLAPDAIFDVPDLPTASDGCPLPMAARRVLRGEPAARVVAEEGVANPASLARFVFLFDNL